MLTTPRRSPSCSTIVVPRPGLAAQEVRGPHDAVVAVQIRVDLPAVVGVVPERDRVDAGGEQLVCVLRRDSEAAGGVLAVDDHERQVVALAQHRQAVEQRFAPDAPDDVAARTGSARARWAPPRNARGPFPPPEPQPYSGDGGWEVRWFPGRARGARGPSSEPPEPEEERLAGAEDETPREPPRAVMPRWVQLVLLPIAIVALWALAKAAGKVLLLFVIAGLIALILNPAVSLLHRDRIPRGLAVLAVYLAFFLTLAGIGFLLSNPISHQVQRFTDNLPKLEREANKQLVSWEKQLNESGVHVKIVKPGKTAVQSVFDKFGRSAGKFASFGTALATEIAGAIFNLVLIFVVSVYMLLYGPQIGALVRRLMPTGDGSKADDYPALVQRAVSRYVGGQLLFSVIMGLSAGLSLYIFGVLGIFPDGRSTRSRSASSTASRS